MKLSHKVSLAATFLAVTVSIHTAAARQVEVDEPPERPNIVVILTDDQDVYSMPAMRNLNAYPEGSWINFTNAFVNDSVCAPSRATLLTGQYSHNHKVTTNNFSLFNPTRTLPVWLNDAGYNTALLGKYHLQRGHTRTPPGWDYFSSKPFPNEVDSRNQQAIDYLNTQTADSPFFLIVSYYAPHAPAYPPERYKNVDVFVPEVRANVNELDVSDKPIWVRRFRLIPEYVLRLKREVQTNKQRELLAIDDGVAAIIDTLKARELLDNTVVIFYSDNGHLYGSHRYFGKWCPYEECSRVPLLIRYPGTPENRDEPRFVSNVDLAATIAEIAGATPTIPQDGRSLLPLLDNTATEWRDSVLLERHPGTDYYGITTPGWKYVEFDNGFKELYDLTLDPFEMQNAANRPEYLAQQALLAQQLRDLRN